MLETPEYIFFWGKRDWGSNFYSTMFVGQLYDGSEHMFLCSEQYYMYYKAIIFKDYTTAQKILNETLPSKIKKLGKKPMNYNSNTWSIRRYGVMKRALLLKFTQNKLLKDCLLATGDKIIVEASPYDKIWGVGLRQNNPLILDRKNWEGANLLGKALMEVRYMLR